MNRKKIRDIRKNKKKQHLELIVLSGKNKKQKMNSVLDLPLKVGVPA